MYALTVVTCVFLPMQFITGVYGMNFKAIPEYDNPYSYITFWIAVSSYVSLFLLIIAVRELWRVFRDRCANWCVPKRDQRRRDASYERAMREEAMHIPVRTSLTHRASSLDESPSSFRFIKRFFPSTASADGLSELDVSNGAHRRSSDLENPLLRRSRPSDLTVV